MSSTIVRLYRYISIFGEVWWLPLKEAEVKLARERALYGKVEHGL